MKTRSPKHIRSLSALCLALAAGLCLTAHAQRTATATATIFNGYVVAYNVTDGGEGYTDTPVVTVVGGGGTGATAIALVATGAVTQIYPVSGGVNNLDYHHRECRLQMIVHFADKWTAAVDEEGRR